MCVWLTLRAAGSSAGVNTDPGLLCNEPEEKCDASPARPRARIAVLLLARSWSRYTFTWRAVGETVVRGWGQP